MISTDPRLPAQGNDFLQRLVIRINELFRSQAVEINKVTQYATTAPTTGSHAKSEFVWNSAPSESGSAGSKYVILGWSCVTSGTPGTWKECRCLTGA